MKRIITCLILALSLCASAASQSDIYKKCEKEKSLTTVYITRAMLQMLPSSNMGKMDSVTISLLRDKIDNVLIVNADKPKGIEFLKNLRKDFSNDKNSEVLMQINEENSEMRLYCTSLGNGKSQYLLSVFGGSHATAIIIEGSLTLDEIMRMTNGFNTVYRRKEQQEQ